MPHNLAVGKSGGSSSGSSQPPPYTPLRENDPSIEAGRDMKKTFEEEPSLAESEKTTVQINHPKGLHSAHTFLYYQVYSNHCLIPIKNLYDFGDDTLGRVPARRVAPPRTVRDIKHCIAQVEGFNFGQIEEVYLDSDTDIQLLDDGAHVPFTEEVITPLCIVLRQPVSSAAKQTTATQIGRVPLAVPSATQTAPAAASGRTPAESSGRLMKALFLGEPPNPRTVSAAKTSEAQGVYYFLESQHRKAIDRLHRAISLDTVGCARAELFMAAAYSYVKWESMSVVCFKHVFRDEKIPHALFSMVQFLKGKREAAFKAFQEVLRLDPPDDTELESRFNPHDHSSLRSFMSNLGIGSSESVSVSPLDPPNPDDAVDSKHPKRSAKIYETQGVYHLFTGRYLDATDCFDLALDLDAEGCHCSNLYRAIAATYSESTRSAFISLRQFTRDENDAHALLSIVLYLKGERVLAFREYQEILSTNPVDDEELNRKFAEAAK